MEGESHQEMARWNLLSLSTIDRIICDHHLEVSSVNF